VDAAMPTVRRMGRDRIRWTQSLAIVIGLVAVEWGLRFVPLPGLNTQAILAWLDSMYARVGSRSFYIGSPLAQMSIVSLGIMPYVSSAYIVQLVCVLTRRLGTPTVQEATSRRLDRATLIGAVLVGGVQAWFIAKLIDSTPLGSGHTSMVLAPGLGFRLVTVCSLVAGTMLLVGLARLTTRLTNVNGVVVLLAFDMAEKVFEKARSVELQGNSGATLLVVLGLGVALSVCVLRLRVPIPLCDARGNVGTPVLHAPYCPAGGAPFAISLLLMDKLVVFSRSRRTAGFIGLLATNQGLYWTALSAVTLALAIAWPSILQFPERTAGRMRSVGLCMPTVQPGVDTEDRLRRLWWMQTLRGGAVFVALAVAISLTLGFDARLKPLQSVLSGLVILILVALCLDGRKALTASAAPQARRMPEGALPAASANGRCPACSSELADGFAVCWSCGGAVAPISPLPAPPAIPEAPPEGGRPVTVARLAFPIDAELARLKLEAEGIPVRLLDYHIVLANWFLGVAVGGIRVQVPEECAPAARELLFPPEPTARAG